MATRPSTRGVKKSKARYAIENYDEFNQASRIRITDESEHRLFTMTRASDSASIFELERWQLRFQCADCQKEHVVTLPARFDFENRPSFVGELHCECPDRPIVAVIGKNGNVRIACQKAKAHAGNPHLVNVNSKDVLATIEGTAIRESVRHERARNEQVSLLGGY